MKLYLDTCCWGRPYDDQTDKEIRDETAAINKIVGQARRFGFTILGSNTLVSEIEANTETEARDNMMKTYSENVTAEAEHTEEVFETLGRQARQAGVRGYDVFHLCHAVASDADYLLTTDKRFLKAIARLNVKLSTKIINPLNFNMGGMP